VTTTYDRRVTDPYWLTEEAPPLPRVTLGGPADVEVVGGGVTGCSAALTLAGAGLRVRLHEARRLAGGASGRNGGFALRGGALPYDRAREWLGHEPAAEYWRLTERYLDRMTELGGDALRRAGSLRLAADADERAELRAEFEALREDGFAAEWRDELPPPLAARFLAAVFHPGDASIHPVRFVHVLAHAAAAAGVELREHSRVESLDGLEAARVLVATDGYPSGLLGDLEGLIVPTRGQMIATEPVEQRLFDVPHYGRHGFDYWQQLEDGRIVAGGFRDTDLESEFTAEEQTTPKIQRALEELVGGLVGRPLRVERRWAGIFGLVLDFLPVVGRVPGSERVWAAGGYSGHGNVLGFACGDLVARAILGEPHPLLALLDPARLLAAGEAR
jgi:gamma-glutamylputrescine oxidase